MALSILAALLLLAALSSPGVALLRCLRCRLDPLEQVVYGAPLGMVVSSLGLLAAASVTGSLSREVVAISSVAALAVACLAWYRCERLGSSLPPGPNALGWADVLVIGFIMLWWAAYWRNALVLAPDGLWAGSVNIWGDWSQHLGDVTSFAYGDNFPPTNPRLSGTPFAYHYLTSLTVAAMVPLGLDPIRALPLHSCVLSFFVAIGIYAFARRLTGAQSAAALALVLFVLGGGLGWWIQLARWAHDAAGLAELIRLPWDTKLQEASNLPWKNVFLDLLAPQRGLLYGLPLALMILTLLFLGTATPRSLEFLIAGLAAGLLPFAHLGTLLALALVTPFLFLLFPGRQWVVFFLVWATVGLPQVWIQQGGGVGAAGAMRLQLGWMAPPDPWAWFWLKNIGLFAPLTVLAFLIPGAVPPRARRFLAGFMPVFAVANIVVFQPWDWDNTKVFAYWFLASCILVSGLLVRIWERGGARTRALTVAAVGSMVLSGVLQNVSQALGRDRHRMLTVEELRLADAVRARTAPRAVFAAGLRHNHPVSLLAGRRVVVGFPGWMWSQGLPYEERARALEDIYSLTEETPGLMERYRVDYVVVGPDERNRFRIDLDGFRSRFPALLRTENYEIFVVDRQTRPPR